MWRFELRLIRMAKSRVIKRLNALPLHLFNCSSQKFDGEDQGSKGALRTRETKSIEKTREAATTDGNEGQRCNTEEWPKHLQKRLVVPD